MSNEVIVDPAYGKFRPPFKPNHTSKHKIFNDTREPIAFKTKTSDKHLRITPVYGIINPNCKALININCLRTEPPKQDRQDKIKICLKAIDVADAEGYLRNPQRNIQDFFTPEENINGFLEIFIITKGISTTTTHSTAHHREQTAQSTQRSINARSKKTQKASKEWTSAPAKLKGGQKGTD